MQKKIPMRQCVGCREMKAKKELVRVVRSPEGEISLDFRGKAPGRGAQLVRSAGDYAQLMAKDAQFAQVRLPSGEVRLVRPNCVAVIGQVGNIDHENVHIGKAGRTRHMGIRPTVRGSVMNPNDHPHGGGEGKSPVGHPGPMTPWGKPAMGLKTRKTKNRTNKYIFKHRNAK